MLTKLVLIFIHSSLRGPNAVDVFVFVACKSPPLSKRFSALLFSINQCRNRGNSGRARLFEKASFYKLNRGSLLLKRCKCDFLKLG